MENIKDLTDELRKLEAKDRFYQIKGEIEYMLAPQDRLFVRPYTYRKTGWGKIERIEAKEDGTPTDLTAPRRKKKVRTGASEVSTAECWSFETFDGGILLPWGSSWGLFKNALRRTLDAKNDRYTNPKLDNTKVYPKKLFINGPIDSQTEHNNPEVVLEPRHTQKGDVRVDVFFDYIKAKQMNFFIEVDSGSPINDEKFVEIIKSLNTLDNFGPSKRGEIRIDSIMQVKPTLEQLKGLK